MKTHPTRTEMINAARSGQVTFAAHLEICDWCRTYFELLESYCFAGELLLPEAPAGWIEKAIAIAEKPAESRLADRIVAVVAFDSWAMPVPGGVRGEGLVEERRLCFESDQIIFDLRAENRQKKWDFIARVTDIAGSPIKSTIIADNKELRPDNEGFYQWTSAKPPKQFKIISEGTTVTTPVLLWKKSQPEN